MVLLWVISLYYSRYETKQFIYSRDVSLWYKWFHYGVDGFIIVQMVSLL